MYTLICIHSTSSNLIQALEKDSKLKLLLHKDFRPTGAFIGRFIQIF